MKYSVLYKLLILHADNITAAVEMNENRLPNETNYPVYQAPNCAPNCATYPVYQEKTTEEVRIVQI